MSALTRAFTGMNAAGAQHKGHMGLRYAQQTRDRVLIAVLVPQRYEPFMVDDAFV